MFINVLALIKKEFLVILKDKRSRIVLVVPVILQTLLFGYVASYDVTKIKYALLDADKSINSIELASKFESTGIFDRVFTLDNEKGIAPLIDNKKVSTVIFIEDGFSKKLASGDIPSVQIIVDARNANMASVISGYSNQIIQSYVASNSSLAKQAALNVDTRLFTNEYRVWFNPNMHTRWTMITGIIVSLATIQLIMITALSAAREREQGTFDQLLVAPVSTGEIMLGKTVPSMIIGIIQATIVILIALFWFKIPFSGSVILFYTGLFIYLLAIVGVGLIISSVSSSMQQGMLYSFVVMMPVIMLSGLATPVQTMPYAFRIFTLANPLRHGIVIARKVYLEGAQIGYIYKEILILSVTAAILLPLSAKLFRKYT